ncbi:MAG: inorganic phosphate transporter [Prevotella sp.]|nr:inorganic phosphate transporter [Prevotella sp.]
MTETIFLGIVIFLLVLAIFDLVVGVSNDAVNFINSAIGAKAASFKVVITIAAIGVFIGASMSNGMMDVARHGIFTPQYYTFYEVMCIFLAVMVTDVVLLDVFNTLGMPTSTTVSMVFELLGGAFAITVVKIASGSHLGFGDLLNTDKALSCILAIFFSVAVAFIVGSVVMWISRLIFTHVYGKVTRRVMQGIVLLGSGGLAASFASNDLVNFVGVPLTGLASYLDFTANGDGNPDTFMMESLQGSAQTPAYFLLIAGCIMVLSLIFSKKAQNVVKTSVDLSRQDEGDEMFGSSAVARTIVRTSTRCASAINAFIPQSIARFVDKRFDVSECRLQDGAAFDMVRAAVNLVLAGGLVAIGTIYKLPLSTTYVTFMVAMGASLADRAWSRESAVFRITGVLSVIGGWFITAGVAFILCFLVCNAMYFGSYIIMLIFIVVAVFIIIRSNINYARKKAESEDSIFDKILRTHDKQKIWQLLCEHIRKGNADRLSFVIDAYRTATDSFITEHYSPLRKGTSRINEERRTLKRQRRREIISMRRLDPLTVMQRNTWYFLGINSCQSMLYGMKRINDPLREHVGNHFTPLPEAYRERFLDMRDCVISVYQRTLKMLHSGDFTDAERLRDDSTAIQRRLSADRKSMLDTIQNSHENINTMLLTVHIIQESQELISSLRHMIRGMNKFAGELDA